MAAAKRAQEEAAKRAREQAQRLTALAVRGHPSPKYNGLYQLGHARAAELGNCLGLSGILGGNGPRRTS